MLLPCCLLHALLLLRVACGRLGTLPIRLLLTPCLLWSHLRRFRLWLTPCLLRSCLRRPCLWLTLWLLRSWRFCWFLLRADGNCGSHGQQQHCRAQNC